MVKDFENIAENCMFDKKLKYKKSQKLPLALIYKGDSSSSK